jgi:hypothetical protein
MSWGISEEPHRLWWNCELRAWVDTKGRWDRSGVGTSIALVLWCLGALVAGLQGVAITMGYNEPGLMRES